VEGDGGLATIRGSKANFVVLPLKREETNPSLTISCTKAIMKMTKKDVPMRKND